MCVCVREREREREECMHAHTSLRMMQGVPQVGPSPTVHHSWRRQILGKEVKMGELGLILQGEPSSISVSSPFPPSPGKGRGLSQYPSFLLALL